MLRIRRWIESRDGAPGLDSACSYGDGRAWDIAHSGDGCDQVIGDMPLVSYFDGAVRERTVSCPCLRTGLGRP